jgi:hypothetical protein
VNRCGALVSAPHSSVFARLASGSFYETIVWVTFYEIINDDGFIKSPSAPFGAGLRFNIPEPEVAFSKKTSIIRHRHKIVLYQRLRCIESGPLADIK